MTASRDIPGVQIGTSASAFISDPTTTLTVKENVTTGLTILSVLTGSNLTVIHQASITSRDNAADGIMADNGSAITLIQSNVTGKRQRCCAHVRIARRHHNEHRRHNLL